MVSATPCPLTPGQEAWYPLYTRLSGPQGRSARVPKISPPSDFLPLNYFSCSLFVLFPYLFLCPDCPGLCLCIYCKPHPDPWRDPNPQSQQVRGRRRRPPPTPQDRSAVFDPRSESLYGLRQRSSTFFAILPFSRMLAGRSVPTL